MDYKKWKISIRQRFRKEPGRIIPRKDSFTYRNETLRKEGFLSWERRYLVLGRIDTPAMKSMRRRRAEMYRAAKITFANYNEYQKRISRWYRDQGWFFKDGRRLNPFAMVEWFKKKDDMPDTPQPKRRRTTKDYITYKERTPRITDRIKRRYRQSSFTSEL